MPGADELVPPALRPAVEAAAVLERFDASALAALLDAPRAEGLPELVELGLVEPQDATGAGQPLRYQLRAELRDAALVGLGPDRLCRLHGLAAGYYARQLASRRAPDAPLERVYMRHLERHCEGLLQQRPADLATAAEEAPLALLQLPRHQQLLRYYRGLGAGLREEFRAAEAELSALLEDPTLDLAIRARALNSAAVFARHQGRYEQALEGYRESYAIWGQVGDRERQCATLINLGIVQYELQDYAAAEGSYRAAADLAGELRLLYREAGAFNELGLLCRDQGRWDEALAYLRRAEELWTRTASLDMLGGVYQNLGEVELLRGHFEAALPYFERALDQMQRRVYAVDVYVHLGLLRQAQGDSQASLEHYQAARRLARRLGRREILPLVHYRIGQVQHALGLADEAQASYDAAIRLIERKRAPMRSQDLLIRLMGRWQLVYEAALLLALERGQVELAFAYAERARARAFADLLAQRQAGRAQARVPPLDAQSARQALPSGCLLLAYVAVGLRGPETQLLDAIPGEAHLLRAALLSPSRLLLFAMTSAGLRAHDCRLNPNALLASSSQQTDGRRFLVPQVLRRAFDALIAPVADLLPSARQLLIVPHGPLHQLPFSALLDASGHPLLERDVMISSSASATLALRARPDRPRARRAAPAPCLALGYDSAEHQLRHTQAEAHAVAAICSGDAWVGAPGVGARLRGQAARYRLLHLACHGEFVLDDPLSSWLEIGPGERLRADEVLEHFQLRAELVSLSACRSGVSKVLRGDEPLGLVRAFLTAGARAVLVTLWPVEDLSARLVMEQFYSALQRGLAPPAALREAQRFLRALSAGELRALLRRWGHPAITAELDASDQTRPFADPAFWAAYVLVERAILAAPGSQP